MAISQYGNEYYGLSGDDKPLGTPLNGRKFTEMDTSKEYRFDAENQQWLQQSGGGGSATLSGLTDVDISNPTDGQTLVYNAESGKWENGAGGGDLFETLGTITSATVPMSYDEENQHWGGFVNTGIPRESSFAARNMTLKVGGTSYSVAPFGSEGIGIAISETESVLITFTISDDDIILLTLECDGFLSEPVITDLTAEVYAPSPELAVFFGGGK